MEYNGGPAFPSEFNLPQNQGLTMRDYFAASAMQGLIVAYVDNSSDVDAYSKKAYEVADAMLEARK